MGVKFGAERLQEAAAGELDGLLSHETADLADVLALPRWGLLMNQASLVERDSDRSSELVGDMVVREFPGRLRSVFSPQHGIWGEQQANMIESQHSRHAGWDVPVYSLYSETRQPTPEMLAEIDVLLIDLQDVGTRVYTFVWTVLECLRACAEHGVAVVILDRPNPLGGEVCEGPMLQAGFESFVGNAQIPMRHGLTIGEFAGRMVDEFRIDVRLHVVPMAGWQRSMYYAETGRRWHWPSPNMPTLDTAAVYPGQVLLEGVNLSEGRGTTRPFEVMGAPWIDPQRWIEAVASVPMPGMELRPVRFLPVFDKWQGQVCSGVELVVRDPRAIRSVEVTASLLLAAASLWPDEFAWLDPPYEYEYEKPPIDILWGSDALRRQVEELQSKSLPGVSLAGEVFRRTQVLCAWRDPNWGARWRLYD